MPTPPKQATPDIVAQIGDAMDKQFRKQYDEALKREVAHTMDLEWLQSGSWVDEIYYNTVNLVARQATISGGIAAKKLGVKVVDFIDRPHVQNAIKSETYKFARSVNQATADKLKATLLEGNKAGDDIRAMTKRVQAVFLGVDPERATSYRAEMIARTESAQAYTVGSRAMWQETGVVAGVQWQASSDACIFCRQIDGMQRKLDEAFFALGDSLQASYQGKLYTMEFTYREILGPALHPNCVMPETTVVAPGLRSAITAHYNGPIARVMFRSGRYLSTTVNHMLLTPWGFCSAALLREGDYVLNYPLFHGSVICPNDYRKPPTAEQIVAAMAESPGCSSTTQPARGNQLHGDGRFCDGEVNIIRANSFLRLQSESGKGCMELTKESRLVWALTNTESFSGSSEFAAMLNSVRSIVGGSDGRKPSSFFSGRLSGLPHLAASMAVPEFDSSFCELPADGGPTKSDLLRDLIRRHPSLIETDPVVHVDLLDYDGTVYDFETTCSLYAANGVLSSNCRCALLAIPINLKGGD